MSAAVAADWTMGGQDINNWRNQSSTGVHPQNVGRLKPKWVFTTGGDVTATPAVANGVVYFPDFAGNFYAVKAATGVQNWSRKISDWTGIAGDYTRDDPVVYNKMLILGDQAGNLATWDSHNGAISGAGAWVMAVDAKTGSLIWKTQVEKFPTAMVTSSPVVYNDIVYVGIASAEEGLAANPTYNLCCVSRGSLVALDVDTGAILWKTYMVPDNGGHPGGYSGGGIWGSTPVIDPKRNSVYVGTGNNYSVPNSPANPVKDCMKANPLNKACTDSTDYFNSVVALDLNTGAIKWAARALTYDAWNVACIFVAAGKGNCPSPEGPDFDFGGSGPNLLSGITVNGKRRDILGIGEKSGYYWALNPDDGSIFWSTNVGPGTSLGGIEWGTASDGNRIYVPISNPGVPYALQPSGARVNSGSWAALDPGTGSILWQIGTPGACSQAVSTYAQGCMGLGPASVANGVVFVGSMDANPTNATMFALDAKTGNILWSYVAGSEVVAGPAIVGNSIYWGHRLPPFRAW